MLRKLVLCVSLLLFISQSLAFFGTKRAFLFPRGGGNGDEIVDLDEDAAGFNVITRSNAVGDPDGEGSSDDEDSDEGLVSDWEDLIDADEGGGDDDASDQEQQSVQVEVEYVEDAEADEEDDSQGGIGVRMNQRHRNSNKKKKESTVEEDLVAVWEPHIYFPPSDYDYLKKNARRIEADGKSRLDRRTLYAELLLELTNASPSSRKFLSTQLAQELQAALSMATQPSWRYHSPRTNAVRLYDPDHIFHGCTVSMQETVMMAVVRCFKFPDRNCYLKQFGHFPGTLDGCGVRSH